MDPHEVPRSRRHLVAVFPDQDAAHAARQALVDKGVPAGRVTIGDSGDDIESLKGEMREELAEAWILPEASFIAPKEGARGFAVVVVSSCVIALLIGIPLAFIDFGPSFWARLVIVEGVLLTMAFVIALVLGPGLASARPEVPMAAEVGTTVRVTDDTERTRALLLALDPIRVDEITDGGAPVATVGTEEDREPDSGLTANAVRGARDIARNVGTDDYHAPSD